MANNDIVIKLEGVSKKYKLFNSKTARMKEALHPLKKKYHREFYALNNINLEVAKGEILGIVGVNGSGKSTLLKIISGIIPPSGGTCSVKGRVIPLLELGSGFNPEFTGLENIYFYNRLNGYTRKQTDAVLDDILDFAEIGDFIHQPLKTYSSGMKARLGFAVSVNIDPDILILDEVLSVGDELFRRKCYARMEEVFKAGKTILFVSHNAQTINQLCTRAVMLDKGECILEGPTKLITTYYQNFLFTKKSEQIDFRKKIIALNTDLQQKSRENQGLISLTNNTIENNKPSLVKNNGILMSGTIQKSLTQSTYLPNFEPKSTKVVKNRDIHFHGLEIRTLQDDQVNMLALGEDFTIRYFFDFHFDATDVFFAYTIKNEKGLTIVNCNTRTSTMPIVKKGTSCEIIWSFSCMLMPGTYYLTIGTGCQKTNEAFMQITDAMVFKVISEQKLTYSGLIHLFRQPMINKINLHESIR
jgi:lipopolysaccharide transport system ATP-binding protein